MASTLYPNIKAGDTVYIAYLAWGRSPTLAKVKVRSIGEHQIQTIGGHGNFQLDKTKVFTDEHKALSHLRDLIQGKIDRVREDADDTIKALERELFETLEKIRQLHADRPSGADGDIPELENRGREGAEE